MDVVEFHDEIVSELCGRAFCFGNAAKIQANDSEKMLFFLSCAAVSAVVLAPGIFARRKLSRRHVHACANAVSRIFLMPGRAVNELT